jgi:large subunit ribosomal protein L24
MKKVLTPVDLHVKTGDTVKVIAGDSRNQSGVIRSVDRKKQLVFIEGLNMKTKHQKPSAQSPQGGIVKMEAGIHVSNVQLMEATNNSAKGTKAAAAKAPAKTSRKAK